MIITGTHLSRRTLLRGAGTALALPLLDAMVPALRAQRTTAAAPIRRLGFVYFPMGVVKEKWLPSAEGTDYQLNESMASLAPHRAKFQILTGLTSCPDRERSRTDFHDRAMASFMTGCEPTYGEVRVGTSVDQLAAQVLGKDTQFASLETAAQEPNFHGGPSFKSATNPLPFEVNPRNVFERLFGDSSRVDPVAAAERRKADASMLDAVTQRISDIKRTLSPGDKRKLDEYVESIRDVERRIEVAGRNPSPNLPQATRPAGIPDSWPEHVKLMFDLQVLALQADLTRVFTFMYNAESSYLAYPQLGITMQHHEISHHNYEADKLAALAKINIHQCELFSYLLSKLDAVKEGGSTLLDHSLIMYGSSLSNPTVHSQHNLPILLCGGASGRIAGGRHVKYEGEPPLTNLYLTMLDKVGVPTEKLGDSTGKLNRLEV